MGLPRDQGGIRDSVPPTPTVPAGLECGKLPKGQCHSEGWALAGGQRRPLETLTSHAVNSPQGVRLLGHRDSQDVPSRSLPPLKRAFPFSFFTSSINLDLSLRPCDLLPTPLHVRHSCPLGGTSKPGFASLPKPSLDEPRFTAVMSPVISKRARPSLRVTKGSMSGRVLWVSSKRSDLIYKKREAAFGDP